MTMRRGRWLTAAAAAAVALGHSAAWGAAAEGSTATSNGESAGSGSTPGAATIDDTSTGSAPPVVPTLKPEEEMLLEVRTDKWILDDSFSGYSTPLGTYLPLGAFTRLLDLAIAVDGDAGRAEGWAVDEKNTFRIDVNAGFVETKDGRKPLKPGDAFTALGDIYVRPELLAKWFPLQADVSLPKQEVDLKLLATFPFEAKMARESKRELLGARAASLHISYPRERTMYEMLSSPALDVNIHSTTGLNTQTDSQYDIRASGDLAFMNTDLFIAGDRKHAIDSVRATMRRRDPDGKLFGHLTLIEVGDTSSAPLSLGVRSRTGRGFVFGNQPIDSQSVFDKTDLRGELAIGWEVELYRNDVLIGSVDHGVDGRYEFTQVPLEYGLNVLRLVFYGPHGERREEVRQINAGQDRLARGQFHFTVSAVQQDKNLIPIGTNSLDTSGTISLPDAGAIRAVASAEYGLSSGITAITGLASFVDNGARVDQGMAGIRTDLRGAAIQLDAAVQNGGAWAIQTGFAGRLFGASYVLQHSEYEGDFVDELRGSVAGEYKRDTQLRVDRGFTIGSRTLATNLVAERAERDGSTEWDATFRASTGFNRWLFSNQFTYRRTDGADSSSSNLDGAFEVNGSLDNFNLRAGIDYNLQPGAALRDLNISVDHDLGSGTVLRAAITHQLTDTRATQAGLSLSRRLGNFDLGADVQYDTGTKALLVGTRISFGFGRGIRGWGFEPTGFAGGGSVIAMAYRDLNGDGKREKNEPAIPGVGFRGGAGEVKTNAQGEAMITGLGDGRPAQVTMLTDTLPDPYMAPVQAGIEVVPRPGRTHFADFPVATVSEAEGHAYFRTGASERAVSNVELQLVDAKENVIATTKTEYDGYFFFERVPPGEYKVRIDPDQAAKLAIQLLNTVPVKAGADGGLVGEIKVEIGRAPTIAQQGQTTQGQR